MSEIDRKRVAAVARMEADGWFWKEGQWSFPDRHGELDPTHVRVLIDAYTQDRADCGFAMAAPLPTGIAGEWDQRVLAAWAALRKAVGRAH